MDDARRIAEAVQEAIEQTPYQGPGVGGIYRDGRFVRWPTLREFFYEDTWQGEYADELFALVAARAVEAVRAVLERHDSQGGDDGRE